MGYPRTRSATARALVAEAKLEEPLPRLLDLPDEVLGLIYQCLGGNGDSDTSCGRASKAALRHTCTTLHRSPSINSTVTSMYFHTLRKTPSGWFKSPSPLLQYLETFPKYAELRTLSLDRSDMAHTLQLCRGASPAARARLQGVKTLRLEYCTFDEGSGSLLPFLLPKLETLRLNNCQFTKSFLCELAPLASLRCLGIDVISYGKPADQYIEQAEAAIRSAAMLTNLQSLSLNVDSFEEIDVSSLADLQQLRELSLAGCIPLNLHRVLASAPLRSLRFESAWLPRDEHYASGTLQKIYWDCLDEALPLHAQDFPCLQVLQFGGIDVCSNSDSWQQLEELVAEMRELAAWAQTFPIRACGHRSGDAFVLEGSSCISAPKVATLLRELLPMKFMAFDVGCVCLESLNLNQDGWSALADLIKGLQISEHPFPSLRLGWMTKSEGVEAKACVREMMPYISKVVTKPESTQSTNYLDT